MNHIRKTIDTEMSNHCENSAANIAIRTALMKAIDAEMDKLALTQTKLAQLLDVSQPRVSNIKQGKVRLFTIDALVNMLLKLGKPVSVFIDQKLLT